MEKHGLEDGNLTFEEALVRLEEVVKLLEGGELSLEKALECFEKGIFLVRHCNHRLNEAEDKIQLLVKSIEGDLVLQPAIIGEEGVKGS